MGQPVDLVLNAICGPRRCRSVEATLPVGGGLIGEVRRWREWGLSFSDRSEISTASKAGWSVRRIARHLGRCPSVISRELHRNSTKTRGYQAVTADVRAQRRRARPQQRKVAGDPVLQARVDADLAASWTPNEIAGRLRLEATDPTVGRMANSPDAQGRTVSGEAIYQYIYAIPRGELARRGIFLQSKRTKRRPRTTGRSRAGRSSRWCP